MDSDLVGITIEKEWPDRISVVNYVADTLELEHRKKTDTCHRACARQLGHAR